MVTTYIPPKTLAREVWHANNAPLADSDRTTYAQILGKALKSANMSEVASQLNLEIKYGGYLLLGECIPYYEAFIADPKIETIVPVLRRDVLVLEILFENANLEITSTPLFEHKKRKEKMKSGTWSVIGLVVGYVVGNIFGGMEYDVHKSQSARARAGTAQVDGVTYYIPPGYSMVKNGPNGLPPGFVLDPPPTGK